jgi:voltage-gated potassium channel
MTGLTTIFYLDYIDNKTYYGIARNSSPPLDLKIGDAEIMYTSILRRFRWPLIAVIAILVIGTIGYRLIAGPQYSFLDTFYMTLITISTIGFGEVIDISAPVGRAFTIFIAIAGVGVMFYIITNATALIVEGELTKSLRRRRMEKKAKTFKNHYIICGMGEVGSHIANELSATKRPYVMIETNKDIIENTLERFKDGIFIEGDATDNDVLFKAGIKQAKGIFVTLHDDNHSLVVSFTAKQLNPSLRVVTQCNELKNSEKMKKAGADAVISTSLIGGLRMASEMVRPTVVSFLDTMLRDKEKNLRVEEVSVPESLAGRTISSLGFERYPGILLLAVRAKEGWIYNPPANCVISPDSALVFIGNPEERRKLEKELGVNPDH